jgi:hypothetical protein
VNFRVRPTSGLLFTNLPAALDESLRIEGVGRERTSRDYQPDKPILLVGFEVWAMFGVRMTRLPRTDTTCHNTVTTVLLRSLG